MSVCRPTKKFLGCCIEVANDTAHLNNGGYIVGLQEIPDHPRPQDVRDLTSKNVTSKSSDGTSTAESFESGEKIQEQHRIWEKMEHLYEQYKQLTRDMMVRSALQQSCSTICDRQMGQ